MITFHVDGVPDGFRARAALRRWLTSVARREGQSIARISYVLMSDRALLTYNRQHLTHDEYTDILTFGTATPVGLDGDILISYDRVKENARTFGVPAAQELRRVMVHGLLHLCGHDDRTKAQREAMRKLENAHLRRYR